MHDDAYAAFRAALLAPCIDQHRRDQLARDYERAAAEEAVLRKQVEEFTAAAPAGARLSFGVMRRLAKDRKPAEPGSTLDWPFGDLITRDAWESLSATRRGVIAATAWKMACELAAQPATGRQA